MTALLRPCGAATAGSAFFEPVKQPQLLGDCDEVLKPECERLSESDAECVLNALGMF